MPTSLDQTLHPEEVLGYVLGSSPAVELPDVVHVQGLRNGVEKVLYLRILFEHLATYHRGRVGERPDALLVFQDRSSGR